MSSEELAGGRTRRCSGLPVNGTAIRRNRKLQYTSAPPSESCDSNGAHMHFIYSGLGTMSPASLRPMRA